MGEDDVTVSDLEKKQEPGQGEDMGEEEEEYVMLDLEAIFGEFDVPPNTPYQLSDLDTMNPILTIGDKLKLIGEYEETVGTCLVFSETDKYITRPPMTFARVGRLKVREGEHLFVLEDDLLAFRLIIQLYMDLAATAPAVHEESGPSEANLFTGTHIIDSTQAPTKQVTHVASLHKILKFRLFIDNDDVQVANTTDETKASCS